MPDFARIARFPLELREIGSVAEIQLDFSEVRFTTPAWLAVIGGTLRQLKLDRPDTKRKAVNFHHLTYAAHMGFFEYFGVNFGQAPDAAPGSDTYVPLSVRRVDEVRRQAAIKAIPVGEAVHAEAERLAMLLTGDATTALQDTLAYSLREIIRNVVEHSGAEDYTFAAQYWPARKAVEIVLSDQGIGLAASLRENPSLMVSNDDEALTQAILPGVSSKRWRRSRHDDDWANSGYGLFMTERLCRLGGSFELMSGKRLLRISPAGSDLLPTNWPGTVVILRLDTGDLGKLSARLQQFRKEGRRIERDNLGIAVGPSRASQTSKPGHWQPSND